MVRTEAAAEAGANRVRQVRAWAGLTQAQLAVEVGVSRQTVSALEAGNYAPSVYLALRIARALSTTVENLFADPAEARPNQKDDLREER